MKNYWSRLVKWAIFGLVLVMGFVALGVNFPVSTSSSCTGDFTLANNKNWQSEYKKDSTKSKPNQLDENCYVPNQVVFVFKKTTNETGMATQIKTFLSSLGVKYEYVKINDKGKIRLDFFKKLCNFSVAVVTIKPQDILKILSSNPNNTAGFYVQPMDKRFPISGVAESNGYWDYRSAVHWESDGKGKKIKIAVLDTGIKKDIVTSVDGKNFAYFAEGYDSEDVSDRYEYPVGHGTGIAELIAGQGFGLLKNDTRIMPVKVCDNTGNTSGYCTDVSIALGLCYAVEKEARVINLSIGGTTASQLLLDALKYVTNKAVVVAPSGNIRFGADPINVFPARWSASIGDLRGLESLISVGAVMEWKNVIVPAQDASWYTNKVDGIDVVAPGLGIKTIKADGTGSYFSGTSYAVPFVVSLAAKILDDNSLSLAQIKSHVRSRVRRSSTYNQGSSPIDCPVSQCGMGLIQFP